MRLEAICLLFISCERTLDPLSPTQLSDKGMAGLRSSFRSMVTSKMRHLDWFDLVRVFEGVLIGIVASKNLNSDRKLDRFDLVGVLEVVLIGIVASKNLNSDRKVAYHSECFDLFDQTRL